MQDDQIILDRTVADQVSTWKSSRGLTDKIVVDHTCSGETCSYYQIGDAFVCEKTGLVHGRIFFLGIIFYFILKFDRRLPSGFLTCIIDESHILFPVCDDTCREVIMDPNDEQLVCRISGHCFDTLLLPDSMEPDTVSTNLFPMLLTHHSDLSSAI